MWSWIAAVCILGVLLAVCVLFVVFNYREIKRLNREIAVKDDEIECKKNEILRQNKGVEFWMGYSQRVKHSYEAIINGTMNNCNARLERMQQTVGKRAVQYEACIKEIREETAKFEQKKARYERAIANYKEQIKEQDKVINEKDKLLKQYSTARFKQMKASIAELKQANLETAEFKQEKLNFKVKIKKCRNRIKEQNKLIDKLLSMDAPQPIMEQKNREYLHDNVV